MQYGHTYAMTYLFACDHSSNVSSDNAAMIFE